MRDALCEKSPHASRITYHFTIMNIEISKKVEQLAPSGIRAFFDLVLGMKDVISLGVGEAGLGHLLFASFLSVNGIEKVLLDRVSYLILKNQSNEGVRERDV